MAVNTPSAGYSRMESDGSWQLFKDLLGGTKTMRAAKERWTPREPDEKPDEYEVRVERSFLYNGLKDTITKCVSRPFAHPIKVEIKNEEQKEKLKPVFANMDGEGTDIHSFARDVLRSLITWGVVHVHVDYPAVDDADKKTGAEEQSLNLRPINRIIEAPSLIGWKTKEQANGIPVVNEVRVKEQIDEEGADWKYTKFDQIRVIRTDEYELWRHKSDMTGAPYELTKTGKVAMNGQPDEIPIATAYAKKEEIMVALPPLLDLAWTNLEHWQSASDQKNILRFDRLGILFAAGFDEAEIKKGIKVSPTQAVGSVNPEASLTRVETTGKPAENGWKDLDDIIERMEILGQAPMIQRFGNAKATGMVINDSKSSSQIEEWISEVNILMKKVIIFNLNWMGIKDVKADDITFEIYQDFVFGEADAQTLSNLSFARKLGDISRKTYINELKRFGALSDNVTPENEEALLRAEQASMVNLFNRAKNGGTQVGATL